MNSTFRRIGVANGYTWVHLNTGEAAWGTRPDKRAFMLGKMREVESASDRPGIFADYHSTTPDLSGIDRARGLHMVRDPRDMLLSAVRYHMTSNEAWLDEPSAEWGGRSFREQLMGYATLEDQIAFEMDTYMGWTIERMAGFDRQEVFMNVRYEDLIVDHDMTRFHDVLVHLGLRGRELINGLEAYWSSSLFGERSEHDKQTTANHVFDSTARQWETRLSRSCIELIESRFGDAIEKLGYPLGS